jgi:hypothetical protein
MFHSVHVTFAWWYSWLFSCHPCFSFYFYILCLVFCIPPRITYIYDKEGGPLGGPITYTRRPDSSDYVLLYSAWFMGPVLHFSWVMLIKPEPGNHLFGPLFDIFILSCISIYLMDRIIDHIMNQIGKNTKQRGEEE